MNVNEADVDSLSTLPYWVKCVVCGEKPRKNDWLIELVRHSNALMHQSCAAKEGKVAGLNIGTTQGELK
jgi:hypothetical protein